jgi:hypothetical protein
VRIIAFRAVFIIPFHLCFTGRVDHRSGR